MLQTRSLARALINLRGGGAGVISNRLAATHCMLLLLTDLMDANKPAMPPAGLGLGLVAPAPPPAPPAAGAAVSAIVCVCVFTGV